MFCKNCGKEINEGAYVCLGCGAKVEREVKPVQSDGTLLTISKIFIILGMILSFWLVVPIIVGIITLNKMKSAKCKKDVTVIGIFCLIFCSFIGGICLLCASDEDLKNYN